MIDLPVNFFDGFCAFSIYIKLLDVSYNGDYEVEVHSDMEAQ
jgi:hypothetical protein